MTDTAAAPAPDTATTPAATPYDNMVLIDRKRHQGLRMSRPADRRFAARMNAVYCAAAEFSEACKSFPLVFVPGSTRDAQGVPVLTPVCLTGLAPDENLFIDADGRWTGGYEPAFLRRHPYAMVNVRGPDGEMTSAAAYDGTFDGLAEGGEGEALFEGGEPTPYLQGVMKFLNDFDAAVALTEPVGRQLLDLGLLKDMRAEGVLPNGDKFSVDGFLVVDEDKLRALPDDQVLKLVRNGLMAVVYAHLVSLSNLARLVERKVARVA